MEVFGQLAGGFATALQPINMAMLFMATKVFNETGHADVATINSAFETLTPLLGGASALVFGISLIASGVSSSAVGTMADENVRGRQLDARIERRDPRVVPLRDLAEEHLRDDRPSQLQRLCDWLEKQSPSPKSLEQLDRAAMELAEAAGMET